MLRLYDTIHGEVRDLVTRDPGRLSMYVCGPTVYDLPHLGHGRFTLVWDVARRWFTFRGLDVHFVSNITDIDDNIINRALREGTTESGVAQTYEDEWWAAMSLIGVARPDDVPHATQYVPEMVTLIESFLADDVAYVISDGVYFDTSRVSDYGLLAGQALDSLRAGARIEASEEKRSPLDFALWKFAKLGEPRWEAAFGAGRPGWHTECVVMSLGLLGNGFDLHCGGLDLKFPHHENERAQAVAAHRPFAQHWGHNGWVMVGDEKMSKSLGNFTSLTDLLARTDARAYRLLVIRSHYRSPIEVSPATIADAERALARLDSLARRFDLPALAGEMLVRQRDFDFTQQSEVLVHHVSELLDEDLNTPLAVAELFDAVSRANTLADQGKMTEARDLAVAVTVLFAALGLSVFSAVHASDDDDQLLVHARDQARSEGNWAEADRLRDELVTRGWIVEDSVEGTRIRRA
ncbi:MAG: cysteine--tRNA ligase [Acidimicrobiaceae bacterium]|nr:cysteine--tRNA ligase [Acidimicrobiaceae bacterium]